MLLEKILDRAKPTSKSEESSKFKLEDLDSLSSSALYASKPLSGGDFPSFGGGSRPLRSAGSSSYYTWHSDPQPSPKLEIKTPEKYRMLDVQGVKPLSADALLYLNSKGEHLGGIENLNIPEMLLLLRKHFGKDKEDKE